MAVGKLNEKRQYVIRSFGDDYIQADKCELRYQCHFCESMGRTYNDYKLYVNYLKGIYFCQRCETTGSVGFDELLVQGSSTDVYGMLLDSMNNLIKRDDESILKYEDSDYFLIPLTKPEPDTMAWNYLMSRGISPVEVSYYSIRTSYSSNDDPRFRGRVVIPNQLVRSVWTDMYTSRSYVDHEIRYKNSVGSKKNHIVFNLHRILQNPKRIIINEGPINSIIAGVDSVGTYGKYVSDFQIRSILDKNPDNIYISLDTDARDKAEQLCSRIKGLSDTKVYLMELPDGKDASDLGKVNYQYYVDEAKEYKSQSIFSIEQSIFKFLE